MDEWMSGWIAKVGEWMVGWMMGLGGWMDDSSGAPNTKAPNRVVTEPPRGNARWEPTPPKTRWDNTRGDALSAGAGCSAKGLMARRKAETMEARGTNVSRFQPRLGEGRERPKE